ncbi:MAG: hypothetical protein IPO81_23290 [Kouleothrix sp.]|nr:hypothetical protein [Kouleothrix sp.]
MMARFDHIPGKRRFLVINYWIGSRDDGYLDGPVLVSTVDYERFHLWDEPVAAVLGEGEYEIVKLYPRGLALDEAERRFASDFPEGSGESPAERRAADQALWADLGRMPQRRYVAMA